MRTRDPHEVAKYLPDNFTHPGKMRSVVLIDEVDKAPRDFPNDMLNELEELYFRVPELGGVRLAADTALQPVIIITSNSEKDLPDAFLRRCIYYNIPFPPRDRLLEIVTGRLGAFAGSSQFLDQALDLFYRLRSPASGLRKKPATAEFLGWLLSLQKLADEAENPFAVDGLPKRTLSNLVKTAEDQAQATEILKVWLEPEALLAFVDDLREAEFNIGVAQYVAVQDLVMALLVQGELRRNPKQLKTLLGPILCGSPSEQADFGGRFDAWVEQMGFESLLDDVPHTAVSFAQELAELEQKSQRWFLWIAAAGIGLLAVVGVVFWGPQLGTAIGTPTTNFTSPSVQLPSGISIEILATMFLLLLLTFLGWRLWLRRQTQLFLERRAVTREPHIEQVSVAGMHLIRMNWMRC